jgi:hypothetical protein
MSAKGKVKVKGAYVSILNGAEWDVSYDMVGGKNVRTFSLEFPAVPTCTYRLDGSSQGSTSSCAHKKGVAR